MITTIIILVESVLVVALAILAYVLNKKCFKARRNLLFKKLAIFDVMLGIQEGIDKFNEKYDVQLKLGFTNDENGKEKPTLIFTDPKDDIESSPIEEEQHSSN